MAKKRKLSEHLGKNNKMVRKIAITGATGNQGGSVARYLLGFPEEYSVRCLTRDPESDAAKALAKLGAEVVRADLTVPLTLDHVLDGCWGVFGVTNFYDAKIKNDPGSEENQGKALVDVAVKAGVKCFVWSTLPSSAAISGGTLVSRIYEGKYHVDAYIKEIGCPAVFLYTGNFYENMVLRHHIHHNKETGELEFRQPVIKEDTKLAMLYVQKDLCAVTKAVFDQWDTKKDDLNHQYLYVANTRISPREIIACVKKATGKDCPYVRLETTGVPDRDIMFQLYNEKGMYGMKELPDPNVLKLGVKLHDINDFVKETLLPHLGLEPVS